MSKEPFVNRRTGKYMVWNGEEYVSQPWTDEMVDRAIKAEKEDAFVYPDWKDNYER